jgi:hypothetical protein
MGAEAELVRFSKSGKTFAILGYGGIEIYTIVSRAGPVNRLISTSIH